MPIHPAMTSRFPLLDGISSFEEFFTDPALASRRAAFEAHPDYIIPVADVRTESAPGPHGDVPLRIYSGETPGETPAGTPGKTPGETPAETPAGTTRAGAPCLVWMHGGAFMAGDLDMPEADWVARELVVRAGIVVVSVDYRLAIGDVTYPVPHDDVVAAARWVRDQAVRLGVDATRISIGGASAGANLAAGAALKLRDTDRWLPHHLILAYPVAHSVVPSPSAELAALMSDVPSILHFPPAATQFFNVNYLGGPVTTADGYAFPALADLRGLGPTLVLNAEYDDLRASGEAFAAALAAAGVDVHQIQVKTMLHGFLNLAANIEPVAAALNLIGEVV